eukprot:TRINITY_DN13126_c0_g1::TRINITY_DN13126_c0_g1_i1::g.31094::m.31094 TRINITY_DN13126_c0_g1::TRINITY_DN13126_c0_g1_i1::g.31094  ORF type:complete len:124 (+),score=0.63 TRINITY_DN13126_c0_g1_i1:117-488(+)
MTKKKMEVKEDHEDGENNIENNISGHYEATISIFHDFMKCARSRQWYTNKAEASERSTPHTHTHRESERGGEFTSVPRKHPQSCSAKPDWFSRGSAKLPRNFGGEVMGTTPVITISCRYPAEQ